MIYKSYHQAVISFSLCCLTLVCSGCASIVCGTKQKVAIKSEPPGATAQITAQPPAHEERTIVTPETVVLRRNQTYRVTITKEGYEETSVLLNQGSNPWVWGNIVLGGLIGCLIDCGTGAYHELKPNEVNVTLNQVPATVTNVVATEDMPTPTNTPERSVAKETPATPP